MCQAVLGVRDTAEIKTDPVPALWGSQSSEGRGYSHITGQFQSRLIGMVPKLEAFLEGSRKWLPNPGKRHGVREDFPEEGS